MEFTPLSNLLITLVILLLAASVFIILQLKNLQAQIEKLSYRLYFEMTRKSDLIPQFLGKMAAYLEGDRFGEIIKLRQQTMQINECGKTKKELENSLWEKFESLNKEVLKLSETKKDMLLLTLEKEKKEAENRVDKIQTTYNQQVQKYNAIAGNILVKPLRLLIKVRTFETF